jgi:Asp-tRNA(Asn)/Glu-tRNA(Gln) amidotransferase A subunit family amidase
MMQRQWRGFAPNELAEFLRQARAVDFTLVHNLTGWPAAVVRCGTSKEGLPVGVQVVGRPWQDATALAVAAHLEKAFGGWRPPPLVFDGSVAAR